MRIGIVGLGIMGSAIADNILRAGSEAVGYDIDNERMSAFAAAGGTGAGSVADAARRCDIILVSLPSESAADSVIAQIASAGAKGLIVAELSTLSLSGKENARSVLSASGIHMLDAPLSGTGAQAKSGDLVVFASGDRDIFDICAPVFSKFCRASHYVGIFGNGTKTKFVANLLVAIHNVAAAEAMLLAKRAGLDAQKTLSVIQTGAGNSRILELRGPMMVAEQFEPPSITLSVWQKDIELIRKFAAENATRTPAFDASYDLYHDALDLELSHLDSAAVYLALAVVKTQPSS